jgi:hypothetical protein
VSTLGELVEGLDEVVSWSVKHRSRIGYFAAVYKRTELMVLAAMNEGLFSNGNQIERLAVVFGNRYFRQLNDHIVGNPVAPPWHLAFSGHQDGRLSVTQQLFLHMNAHVCYDLCPTLAEIGSLPDLRGDFNRLNRVTYPTFPHYFNAVARAAPVVGVARRFVPGQSLIGQAVFGTFRELSWRFAEAQTAFPRRAREIALIQGAWATSLALCYRQPLLTPFLGPLVQLCESDDVVATIRALE